MVSSTPAAENGKEVRKIRWLGTRAIPLDKLLAIRDSALPIEIAEAWLTEIFKQRDEILATEIVELAKKKAICLRTLKRAKTNLGIGSHKKGGKFYWRRAGTPKDPWLALQDGDLP